MRIIVRLLLLLFGRTEIRRTNQAWSTMFVTHKRKMKRDFVSVLFTHWNDLLLVTIERRGTSSLFVPLLLFQFFSLPDRANHFKFVSQVFWLKACRYSRMEQISLILSGFMRGLQVEELFLGACFTLLCCLSTLISSSVQFSSELNLMSLTIHPSNEHLFSLFEASKIFF